MKFFEPVILTKEFGGIDNGAKVTNKPLSRWGEIFGDSVLANAILDRLLHHSNVINIVGRYYSTKDIIEDDN